MADDSDRARGRPDERAGSREARTDRGAEGAVPRRMTADHAAHAHHEHEDRYREGDAAAWDRPIRDTELYDPTRHDVYNFIDETKVRHLRPMLPVGGNAIEVGAGSGRLLIGPGQSGPSRPALLAS